MSLIEEAFYYVYCLVGRPAMIAECLSRFRLNCSHHCAVTDKGGAACRCPFDQALRSDNVTCYPLGESFLSFSLFCFFSITFLWLPVFFASIILFSPLTYAIFLVSTRSWCQLAIKWDRVRGANKIRVQRNKGNDWIASCIFLVNFVRSLYVCCTNKKIRLLTTCCAKSKFGEHELKVA